MREFAIEFVGTFIGGALAHLFERAARHHRPRPKFRPRPGGYWN